MRIRDRVWAAGKRVVKFIGYDAGESYRSDKVLLGDLADPKYSKWYPLMEWGWDRAACQRAIDDAGLPQPGKSSCFFCPSMRAEEIIYLRDHHPDLFRRAIALEDNARPNLKTVSYTHLDLLSSPEIENILENSDFIYMLNQAAGDRKILAERLGNPAPAAAFRWRRPCRWNSWRPAPGRCACGSCHTRPW